LLSKTVSVLMKAKIVRFLSDLNIENGINSKDAAFASYGVDCQTGSGEDSSWTLTDPAFHCEFVKILLGNY